MSIAADRALELERKLASFPAELATWLAVSEAGQPFEKHHTQIRRLALQMTGLHDTVLAELQRRAAEGTLLTYSRSIEQRALAVHTVWDFFRSKFALRAVEPAGSYLKTADAFARECYEAPASARREPPLVTFDNRISPWALTRERRYHPPSDPGGFLGTQDFTAVIERLPIPLLGLPWHYAAYLPHLVFLAHEAGHAYERDHESEEAIAAALDAAPLAPLRRAAWQAWRREVYADLHAVFTAGPAYAAALAELLQGDPARIAAETAPEQYPSTTLRILLAAQALQHLGDAQADQVRTAWRGHYPTHGLQDWEDDLPIVVTAVYAAVGLPDALAWKPRHQTQARTLAALLRAGASLSVTDVYPVRVLVAAARELMDAPAHWAALIAHAVRSRPPGLLAGDTRRAATFDAAAEHQAGAALAARLFDGLDD